MHEVRCRTPRRVSAYRAVCEIKSEEHLQRRQHAGHDDGGDLGDEGILIAKQRVHLQRCRVFWAIASAQPVSDVPGALASRPTSHADMCTGHGAARRTASVSRPASQLRAAHLLGGSAGSRLCSSASAPASGPCPAAGQHAGSVTGDNSRLLSGHTRRPAAFTGIHNDLLHSTSTHRQAGEQLAALGHHGAQILQGLPANLHQQKGIDRTPSTSRRQGSCDALAGSTMSHRSLHSGVITTRPTEQRRAPSQGSAPRSSCAAGRR